MIGNSSLTYFQIMDIVLVKDIVTRLKTWQVERYS